MNMRPFLFSLTAMAAGLLFVQEPVLASVRNKHKVSVQSVPERVKNISLENAFLNKRENKRINSKTGLKQQQQQIVAQGCPRPGSKKFTAKEITQKDFEGKNRNGILLTKPGHYMLKSNICFKPNKVGAAAITISASNITIDLGQYTLKQGNGLEQVYGIYVCREVNRISIKGQKNQGSILDFTSDGIRILGQTSDILIENLIVTQCEPRQFPSTFDRATLLFASGITIGEGSNTGASMLGTDRLNHVNKLEIKNVECSKCVVGLNLVKVFGVRIENSNFVENTWNGAAFGGPAGSFIQAAVSQNDVPIFR